MSTERTSALRTKLRLTVLRALWSATLGLTGIATGVVLATLTRVSLWWVPLACGTVAFGVGLALVPRVHRLKNELAWAEQRARRVAKNLALAGES
jgi:hypothetical protein